MISFTRNDFILVFFSHQNFASIQLSLKSGEKIFENFSFNIHKSALTANSVHFIFHFLLLLLKLNWHGKNMELMVFLCVELIYIKFSPGINPFLNIKFNWLILGYLLLFFRNILNQITELAIVK